MKIKNLKYSIYLLAILTIFISCKKDDDEVMLVPIRDRAEQQVDDKVILLEYLTDHYYNSGFFETGSNHKYTDIVITERQTDVDGNLLPIPDGHTLLIDAVVTKTTTYFDVAYDYYTLNLNQGGGDAPRFTDAVRVRYEGTSVVDDDPFDVISTPEELLLTGNGFSTFGAIKAWQLILPDFNSSSGFSTDINGITNFNNFGLGIMYVPSGLAYFAGTNTGRSYDNLIFKFELLQVEEFDHDGDGVPSYIEDLDNDIVVENDDTDDDGLPNFVDFDDDGDGVATIDELVPNQYVINNGDPEPVLGANEYEISRSENSTVTTINTVTIVDANSNGTADYLDADVTTNYNENN